MKRKQMMICNSIKEMNHITDYLVEQGYMIESQIDVHPIKTICFNVYRVYYWK